MIYPMPGNNATLKFDFIVEIAAAYVTYSSSRPKSFCKIGILEKFAKFTRKHLCWSHFLYRVAALRPEACFPVNCAKLLKNRFVVEHLRWLLLNVYAHANNSPSLMFERFVFTLPPSRFAYVINKWPSLTTL